MYCVWIWFIHFQLQAPYKHTPGMCMYLKWHVKTDLIKKIEETGIEQLETQLGLQFCLPFNIYCFCINLVPFLFISVKLSTFPFPLKAHSELLVHCNYPVLYQLMEPTCKEVDVDQFYMWDTGLVDWFSYSLNYSQRSDFWSGGGGLRMRKRIFSRKLQ